VAGVERAKRLRKKGKGGVRDFGNGGLKWGGLEGLTARCPVCPGCPGVPVGRKTAGAARWGDFGGEARSTAVSEANGPWRAAWTVLAGQTDGGRVLAGLSSRGKARCVPSERDTRDDRGTRGISGDSGEYWDNGGAIHRRTPGLWRYPE
jgi:hypothetical protein